MRSVDRFCRFVFVICFLDKISQKFRFHLPSYPTTPCYMLIRNKYKLFDSFRRMKLKLKLKIHCDPLYCIERSIKKYHLNFGEPKCQRL